MRKGLLSHYIVRMVAWVLLIQVVNISIDPIDPISDKIGRISFQEDLSINDIESIYELLSEHCLGIEIPEHDEDDESGFVKVFFFTHSSIEIKKDYRPFLPEFFITTTDFNSIVGEQTSPPPKRA